VESPTKTALVRSLVQAYSRAFDASAVSRPMRVGLSAAVMRQILVLGLATPVPTLVRNAALILFMFLFGCRASTAVSMRRSDLEVTEARATAVLVHRKGKRMQDHLVLEYDRNTAVSFENSPLALLRRWVSMRLTSDVFFALADEEDLSATEATYAVAALLSALPPSVSAPTGCTYSSHSARIGAYDEWLALSFPAPWIMHRMGWESDGMLRVT
jgi:integrase